MFKKSLLILFLIFALNGISSAEYVSSFVVTWTQNGQSNQQSLSPAAQYTINRDSGTSVSVRINEQTGVSSPVDYFYADVNNGKNDTIRGSTSSSYTFPNVAGPLNTLVYVGINTNSDALRLTVNNIVSSYPDLTVTHVVVAGSTTPSSWAIGQTVKVECNVYNVGSANANASTLAYYIGTSCSDTSNRWATDSVSSLVGNGISPEYSNYTFQQGDSGSRYFILFADYLNVVN